MRKGVPKLALACVCAGGLFAFPAIGADEKPKPEHSIVVFDVPGTLAPSLWPFARGKVTFTFPR